MPPDESPDPAEPDWRDGVAIREDPELSQQLRARLPGPDAPRSISVTELLAPRPAFWRLTGHVAPTSPDRERRLEEGRRVHRELGTLFAQTGELEVRVRRGGVHGRVDVLSDRPIEVKTSSAALPSDDLLRARPDHVDQLAMYCALLDRNEGRLVYVRAGTEQPPTAAVYDVNFRSLPALRQRMDERAVALREAILRGRAAPLGRCSWFGRGCEWEAGGICDCTGGEPESPPLSTDHLGGLSPRPDLAPPLEEGLAARVSPGSPPIVEMFRDLIYPRRAFFRRNLPPPPAPTAPPARPSEPDLYRRLNEAVESGPLGEVARLATRSEEPDEEVGGFRGEPYLVRTSRVKARISAGEWLAHSPQYFLDLGFRCVATGRTTGRVIVGYELAARETDRLQVLEVSYPNPTKFSRLWRHRSERLGRALGSGNPGMLPPCPGWMYSGCDYREVCGCGSPTGRPQWKITVDAVRRNPSVS